MKRRFYFTLLVFAVILLAIPGIAAKTFKGVSRRSGAILRKGQPCVAQDP